MKYSVEYKNSALKEIERLEKQTQRQILDAVDKLGIEPRPSGVKKIRGDSITWRIRIGKYRVVYRIYEARLVVMIVRVAHRKDAYLNLPK